MPILVGVLFALPGALAVLVGLSGRRRARRLRRGGSSAWATAVPMPVPAGQRPEGAPDRVLLQYSLADGRVLEQIAPRRARKSAALRPGQQVLVWYDPKDPREVLVYGREGRVSDLAFVIAGTLFILLGMGLAALGH
jgi:Protein of unknown function (DUF3592)/Mu transposase, C-terminal